MKYQIVVSGRDQAATMARTLVSVDLQEHDDFDVVVVDNDSSDVDAFNFTESMCHRKEWYFVALHAEVSPAEAFLEGIDLLSPDDDTVIVFVHSGDRFMDGGTLHKLDAIYATGVDCTIGGSIKYEGSTEPYLPYNLLTCRAGTVREVAYDTDYYYTFALSLISNSNSVNVEDLDINNILYLES